MYAIRGDKLSHASSHSIDILLVNQNNSVAIDKGASSSIIINKSLGMDFSDTSKKKNQPNCNLKNNITKKRRGGRK